MSRAMEARKALEWLILREQKGKYPNVPEKARYVPNLKLTTTNGLTSGVIKYIQLSGGIAERRNNTGRYIQPTTYDNIFGKEVVLKKGMHIKGTGKNGTADISGIYNGVPLAIEIKLGKDKQSKEQIEYQIEFERVGGYYLIAKTFAQFYEDFNKLFKINSPEIPVQG
ncbi:hypothetical protein ACOCEA_03380 [Maribacter sp. CXY002]|uniref:hypothetical protein n=1 Tax=Maribacter luteocoastalis TaxID=3407671 RepID=UPI003B66E04A